MASELPAAARAARPRAVAATLTLVLVATLNGCSNGGERTASEGDDASATASTASTASSGTPATAAVSPSPTSSPSVQVPTPGDDAPAEWPPYASTIEPVTAERLGASWRPGCPVDPADLRLVSVTYAGPSGAETGELVVAASVADDVAAVFGDLYAARFPITRVATVDAYGGDDDASMAADNTSAFNCRPVTGGDGWSRHAYGQAIDVNPLVNPYVDGDTVLPPSGRQYLDRADVRAGMIVAGDAVVTAFAARGFSWGGDFRTLKDYQHFARP